MLAALGATLALALLAGLPGPGASSRAAEAPGEPVPQTDASVPATSVTMFGASPGEAPDETWGLGIDNGASTLVRYTRESGWSTASALLDREGHPLSGFRLDQPEGGRYSTPSPLAGQMTAGGDGVLGGTIPVPGSSGAVERVLLVRNPGGAFQQIAPPEGEAALKEGEKLLGVNRAPMIAALDEGGGVAGALVVPVNEGEGKEERVLHWNGSHWSAEPIEVPVASQEEFQVLAISASSPQDAWLIARLSSHYPTGSIGLFRRRPGTGGEPAKWVPVTLRAGGEAGEPIFVEGREGNRKPFTVPQRAQSQLLTATGDGVWIDGERTDAQSSATMFFKPEGEAAGSFVASWCGLPSGSGEPCTHELPEQLPAARVRSFAWANSSTPEALGERVLTGFPDGVSLRLDGTQFTRVSALGGSPPPADVGGSFGSAFSTPREGWLGQERLPVHLTLNPIPSRLTPWPAAFRRALLAVAPAPGQPVGALTSEALAVGDRGEVARFKPGEGWVPESLMGNGGRHESPRLRAVAWPVPSRVYAVGDLGQMWLWRGETGLWEPDPATPLNFRGNLLSIGFDPSNSARGYAVGQNGVLLDYGKTWTQEPEEGIPPPARGASYSSIAFAGSEAIVAYRKIIPSSERYEGGLIVNDGSGWRLDTGAAAVMGGNAPWAVAGLPDGGAAFTASGVGEGGQVYERQSAGAPWQATPTPYPADASPASLALFREAGALRAVAVGSAPNTFAVDNVPSPPPGFPPTLIEPYPLSSSQETGVLRQTSSGWSDEEHELNDVEQPPGEYERYDTVYEPDPVAALLVNSSGALGWAVGGIVDDENEQMDTADVWRYPADGVQPTGLASAPVPSTPTLATFAIAGGAQCAAPCADRDQAQIGPDVWLHHALQLAGQVAGIRAFLYTGARVTNGKTAGPATLQVPYAREQGRYAAIVGSSAVHAYVAPAGTDLDASKTEQSFSLAFSGFPEPFGNSPAAPGLEAAGRSAQSCAVAGSQCAYYAINSGGTAGRVRVVVLDDSTPVGEAQLEWLTGELKTAREAKPAGVPAIVVGNADLPAEIAAGEASAAAVAKVLVEGGASAYFFNSPEQNVTLPLQTSAGSIPSFGSGTLGYVSDAQQALSDFIGASGIMLAQVNVAARNPTTNVAPVSVRLVPNIGELALEGEDGTLLRRSQVARFEGLARRPRSGNVAHNGSTTPETDPYIPIPSNCVGSACAHGLLPEYTFTSSEPKVGNFVEPNLASTDPLAVLQGATGEPIPDPQSGLFCAYNPGTTTVTITAGGLSSSLPVTVQPGSVREPCGTVPIPKEPLPSASQSAPAPPPAPAPAPASAPPSSVPLPAVPPPAPLTTPVPSAVPTPHPAPPTNFFVPPSFASFIPAFVPAPLPQPARPTPPSGTSAVTSPVEAPEKEEEEEAAPESASNEAVAYRTSEHEPPTPYILGLIVLAALAGAAMRGRPRRRGREVRVAPATISSLRSHRRFGNRRDRLW